MYLNQRHYLVVIDYYSRYIELAQLNQLTSSAVITKLKSIFAHHGIPQTVVSDNGPQYDSAEFQQFANVYGFQHAPTSPLHASANGEVERSVQTVKRLLKGSPDPYLALLSYRATPLANGFSPAELCFGRQVRTTVPTLQCNLLPKTPNQEALRTKEGEMRQLQEKTFNKRHRATPLSVLHQGQQVYIPDRKEHGTVMNQTAPRSHQVQTPTGVVRRNRVQLNVMPIPDITTRPVEDANNGINNDVALIPPDSNTTQQVPVVAEAVPADNTTPESQPAPSTKDVKTSRCGRAINLPLRYQ